MNPSKREFNLNISSLTNSIVEAAQLESVVLIALQQNETDLLNFVMIILTSLYKLTWLCTYTT